MKSQRLILWFSRLKLDGKTLAALGTTTCEHCTTTFRGHTGTEAMALGTLTSVRLVSALHIITFQQVF
jgi:hypothetical protein